jgi:hypothetical protein
MTESARSNGKDTSLLGELLGIDFSTEEKERIGRALTDTESAPARILASSPQLIHDPRFWDRAQRKFGVNGFRPGAAAAIPKVVGRVLDAARSHVNGRSSADWPNIWPLYQRAAGAYLDHNRPALSKLLRNERLQEGAGRQTDQIFRSIVKCMPIYEVPVEHVRELYECWGFQRTDLIEEILSDVAVRADTVRRMIDGELSNLKDEILESLAADRDEKEKLLGSFANNLASVRTALAVIRNDLERTNSEWRSAALAVNTSSSPPAAGTQKAEACSRTTIVPQRNSQETVRSPTTLELLHTRVESLGKQLKDLRRRIDEGIRDQGVLAQRGPTQVSTSTDMRAVQTSLHVIEKWRRSLNVAGAPDSAALAEVVLEIVRRSRVLMTTRPELLKDLFSSFPDSQIRIAAASPLWLSEADWKDDLAYIQQERSGPRLLIIENFDSALQDAYLVPPLLAWLASVTETSANRIALIPSVDDLSDVSPRILEISTCVAHKAPHLGWFQIDEGRMKSRLQVHSVVDLLKFVRSTDPSGERGLSQFLSNQKVLLPSRLIRGFVNVYDGLRALLPPREARLIAQDATLIPWGERAFGATQLTLLRNALHNLDEP